MLNTYQRSANHDGMCVIDRIHIATHHILFNTHRNIIETCQFKGTTIDELLRSSVLSKDMASYYS